MTRPATPEEPAGGGAAPRRAATPEQAADGGTAARRASTPDPDGTAAGKRTYGPDFLTALFQNPLDPGYADAAARRAAGHHRTGARRATTKAVASVTMVAIGFLLVIGYQQTVADEPGRTQAKDALIKQVESRRDQTEQLQVRADALADQVEKLREQELGGATTARLDNLEAAAGLAAVRGSGARVRLMDGPASVDAVTGERSTANRVKDTDLQLAANALWAAGAEAIAINGQRLTATSTIRQAGEAILVDTRPVTTPYEVIALGPDRLADDFRDGYAGKFFDSLAQSYGISFEAAKVRNVTLDAAPELKLRSASPSTPAPAPSGASSVAGSGVPAGPASTLSPSEGGR
ncbi:hypothetical protein Acy02nite_04290 [Actinoplanes cyaneus]|uniref:DUF881 domain-containing protein n=1 Tax=Actinoplanes cyaneus TaxID=52696 RepID=A0A919IFL6_9ACTN|nr:DUF881 domain-containing protein [Actinoplanes cyaneus]MCW2136084.1 Uncharacterized conserved protein YlxW, UPF0749 family [Actinoplanes cyaneus]GID62548.1 hypothetical protein Acy02nite_04290 [Actinoplanes cyaneus]